MNYKTLLKVLSESIWNFSVIGNKPTAGEASFENCFEKTIFFE